MGMKKFDMFVDVKVSGQVNCTIIPWSLEYSTWHGAVLFLGSW